MAAALARHCRERGIVKHLCRRAVRALLPRHAPLRSALPWLRHVGRGRRCAVADEDDTAALRQSRRYQIGRALRHVDI
jgi:hypothetical protein